MKELENLKTLRIIPGFLAVLALGYFCYSIDKSLNEPKTVEYGKRTVEEIINTPQPYAPSTALDPNFKSAIKPIKEQ
jgi:hypothetical protein